jgi:tRNA G18 (ribose-2'-O)-methylase SpoU
VNDLDPYAHVGDTRWLAARGLFVAEGRLVVRRLVESGTYRVESLLLTPAARESLHDVASRISCPVHVRSPEELFSLTGFNFHRGCLAIARRPAPRTVADLAGPRFVVAMEGIGNPDNVGGIFRSAAAFGAGAVVLDGASADPFYRKSIRTSMAAVLRVPFAAARQWPDDLGALRDAGYLLAALTPGAGAEDLDAFAGAMHPGQRVVLLVGTEGRGLSDAALAFADRRVRIPMVEEMDSLNVVVACSLALYRLSTT